MHPDFQKAVAVSIDPWKTIVQMAGEEFTGDQFSNFTILGKYDGAEKVTLNAWAVVGLAPKQAGFVECHFALGRGSDKPFWIAELRDIIPALRLAEKITLIEARFLGGALHAKLGLHQYHVLGMVTLHQAVKTQQSFAVLWVNPEVERITLESIMAFVLDERLKN